jgi:hypothetical protein
MTKFARAGTQNVAVGIMDKIKKFKRSRGIVGNCDADFF